MDCYWYRTPDTRQPHMLRARLQPRWVSAGFVTLCVIAWVAGCAVLSSTGATPPNRLPSWELALRWTDGSSATILGLSDLADFEEDDDQQEARRFVPISSLSLASIVARLPDPLGQVEPEVDPRGNSPGARRGPPPRMPPA